MFMTQKTDSNWFVQLSNHVSYQSKNNYIQIVQYAIKY